MTLRGFFYCAVYAAHVAESPESDFTRPKGSFMIIC